MLDGLHIHIQNRIMKPLAIALSVAGERVTGERWWVQSNQAIENWHNESPMYSEYTLVKILKT
jgi:hypothetical protein